MKDSLPAFLPASLLHWIRVSSICSTSQCSRRCSRILAYTGSSHSWLHRMIQFAMSFLERTRPSRYQSFSWRASGRPSAYFWYITWATSDGVEMEWGSGGAGTAAFWKWQAGFSPAAVPHTLHFAT